MAPDPPAPVTIPTYDVRSLAAAGLCIAALFFDTLGWPMAIVGVVLLRRAVFGARIKWMLAALALVPKIAFLAVRSLGAPAGLSFTIEPTTLATSSSLWAWSVLLAAFGVFVMLRAKPVPPAPGQPPPPPSRQPLLLKSVGFVAIAAGVLLLSGLTDGFHRIDDAGEGRWALKHAARGTVATFKAGEVASIEGREVPRTRGASRYAVRLALADGRSFSVSTPSVAALREVRAFATTANLGAGKVKVTRRGEGTWTNGATGFMLKDFAGAFEHADKDTGERTTMEFWIEGDRLAGKETVVDGKSTYVRALRNISVADTGEMRYDLATRAEAGKPSESTMSFSLNWSSGGDSARLTNDGLQVGARKFARR